MINFKKISLHFYVLLLSLAHVSCASVGCHDWKLTSKESLSLNLRLTIPDQIIAGFDMSNSATFHLAYEKGNELLHNSSNTELHECNIVDGTLDFSTRSCWVWLSVRCNKNIQAYRVVDGVQVYEVR